MKQDPSYYIHLMMSFGERLDFHQSIYICPDRKLLLHLIGGYHYEDCVQIHDIHSYNVETRKHQKPELKMAQKLEVFECVMPEDEKYIIIIGGETDNRKTEGIYFRYG